MNIWTTNDLINFCHRQLIPLAQLCFREEDLIRFYSPGFATGFATTDLLLYTYSPSGLIYFMVFLFLLMVDDIILLTIMFL